MPQGKITFCSVMRPTCHVCNICRWHGCHSFVLLQGQGDLRCALSASAVAEEPAAASLHPMPGTMWTACNVVWHDVLGMICADLRHAFSAN